MKTDCKVKKMGQRFQFELYKLMLSKNDQTPTMLSTVFPLIVFRNNST